MSPGYRYCTVYQICGDLITRYDLEAARTEVAPGSQQWCIVSGHRCIIDLIITPDKAQATTDQRPVVPRAISIAPLRGLSECFNSQKLYRSKMTELVERLERCLKHYTIIHPFYTTLSTPQLHPLPQSMYPTVTLEELISLHTLSTLFVKYNVIIAT